MNKIENRINIKIKDFLPENISFVASREMWLKIRKEIENRINNKEYIILDFIWINWTTISFLDELIWVLNKEDVEKYIEFINYTDDIKDIIYYIIALRTNLKTKKII